MSDFLLYIYSFISLTQQKTQVLLKLRIFSLRDPDFFNRFTLFSHVQFVVSIGTTCREEFSRAVPQIPSSRAARPFRGAPRLQLGLQCHRPRSIHIHTGRGDYRFETYICDFICEAHIFLSLIL